LLLKSAAPTEGDYDVANVYFPMLLANLNMESNQYNIKDLAFAAQGKPLTSGFILTSYAYYHKLPCTDLMFRQFCNLSNLNLGYSLIDLFNNSNLALTDEDRESLTYQQAAAMPNPYSENNNSIASFVITPFNPTFNQALTDASLVKWQTKSPITLIYLKYSSGVSNLNSVNAYNGMLSLSDPQYVNRIIINNANFYANSPDGTIEHNNAPGIVLPAALSVFRQYP
jgi:hypothetical protein